MGDVWPAGTASALLHLLASGDHPECALVLVELVGDNPTVKRTVAKFVQHVDELVRCKSPPKPRHWLALNEYRLFGMTFDDWRVLTRAALALDTELRNVGALSDEMLADSRHAGWRDVHTAVRLYHTIKPNDQAHFRRAAVPLLELNALETLSDRSSSDESSS